LAALLLTAACGSMGGDGGGLGSIGDIILGSPSSTTSSDVKGAVTYVDTGARRIDLDVTYVNSAARSTTTTTPAWSIRTKTTP
jgi:predicted GNAT family acetyltransferase